MVKRVGRWLVGILAGGAGLWLAACLVYSIRSPRPSFSVEELSRTPEPLPRGFLWGTATAAHQIEGGNHNDWTEFEAVPGHVEGGDTSAVAVDHWNRMGEDVALMKAIGANAYRFSIEWSRLEPTEGEWNEEAWGRYRDLLRRLEEAGITPMVTLLHFTLPVWLAQRGGVTAPDFPDRFARFASEAAQRLGPSVKLWCTVNEPNVQMYLGYVVGAFPPGERSPARAAEAWRGLLRGHAAAARALRAGDPDATIGVANNLMVVQPEWGLSLLDWLAVRFLDQAWNWAFADAVKEGRARLRLPGVTLDAPMPALRGSVDYFGLNYYFRYLVHVSPGAPGGISLRAGSGMVSELSGDPPPGDAYPEGLLVLIREAWGRYHLPIYVTEGGIADARGTMRGALLRGHVESIDRALAEEIPVRGYFHWTLMDNFEWDKGYRPRFGLYAVDRQTLERSPAGGADVFAALAPPG